MRPVLILILTTLMLVVSAKSEPSLAEKLAAIDAGGLGIAKQTTVTRIQSLLNQLTSKYHLSEIDVADKVVFASHKLLRDQYGITQSLLNTMEDLNRILFPNPQKGDFDKVAVVYVQMRDAGQPREEAILRLNSALAMNPRALDVFLDQ